MASNVIKGLTVEIGGDTTQLGKALQDVEKKARDFSTELRDVNKLLKFDPGNADLLAQKQEILSEALDNTSKKLETLKEAEKQVQKQFEKGEASEEQVRALQREIIATEQTMKRYEKQAQEVADAIDHLGDSADDVTDEVKDTGTESKKAAKNVDKYTDSAKDADKASEGMGASLANAAKVGFAAIAAAATAAVAGLVAAAESSREYRTAMGKLNTAFTQNGFTAEEAQGAYKELQGILGDTDQAVEAANHLAQLTNNEKELAKWTGDIMPGIFATFGDSLPVEGLAEAANETAKVGQVTGPLADALNWAGVSEEKFNEQLAKCSNEQQRQALITSTLTKLYGGAAKAYKETNAEVIRANQANEEWTASMAGIGGAIEPIITDVKMFGATLLSNAVPGVKALAEAFRGIINGEAGSAEAFGKALSGLVTSLLEKVNEMLPTVLEVGVTLVTTLVQSIAEMLPSVVDTIVQVIPQLITALVGLIPTLLTSLASIVTSIINGIAEMLPTIVDAVVTVVPQIIDSLLASLPQLLQAAITLLMAIVEAIPTIITALVDALPGIIDSICTFLTENMDMILQAAIDLLMAILDALPVIIRSLNNALPKIIQTITKFLVDNIDKIVDAAITMFMAIIDAIPEILDAIVSNMPQIIGAIVNGIIEAVPKIWSAALELGKGLVQGLWQGVQNLGSWLWDKLTGWGDSIVNWVKGIFDINSPSRVFRDEVGKNIGLGVAEGILDSTDAVGDAMGVLGDSALNGLSFERDLQGRNVQMYETKQATTDAGLMAKLDRILGAIEAGQVLAIDGKLLVGGTANQYDNALGQRRLLAARGAL